MPYQIGTVYGVPLKAAELLLFFKHFAKQSGTECADLWPDRNISAEQILNSNPQELIEALDFDLDESGFVFYGLPGEYYGVLGFLVHEGRYDSIPIHMQVKEQESHKGKKQRLVALLSSVTGETIRYNLLTRYAMHLIIRES
ncbi:MAG: hypothetical protein ACYCQJ_13525 [Nitrososphaerales archaeon]